MYTHVLVPVDLSEEGFSDRVVEEAIKLCAPGGRLILLTVVAGYQMPMVGSFFPEGAFSEAINSIRAQLAEFAKTHVPETLNLSVEQIVKEGNRAETIIKQASASSADLIVMASHKRAGVDRVLVGSVTSKVVNLSPVPVLVVKA